MEPPTGSRRISCSVLFRVARRPSAAPIVGLNFLDSPYRIGTAVIAPPIMRETLIVSAPINARARSDNGSDFDKMESGKGGGGRGIQDGQRIVHPVASDTLMRSRNKTVSTMPTTAAARNPGNPASDPNPQNAIIMVSCR